MPYRREHNCTLDEEVTENLEPVEKDTSVGVLKFVRGQRPNGTPGVRAVRIPAHIPVNEANRMCNTLGGQFSPATPLNPKKQLLRENPTMGHIETWAREFEMPFSGLALSELKLPSCPRCFLLGHKELPYKNPDGSINLDYVKSSLSRVNLIKASATVKLTALRKLLRLARVYGIKTDADSKFMLSDLDLFLTILSEVEEDASSDTRKERESE